MSAVSEPVAASGASEAEAPTLGFSRERAQLGDTVFLSAPISGLEPGSPITFVITEASGDPEEPIATLTSALGPDGVARAMWTVKLDPTRLAEPVLVFSVELEDDLLVSAPLILEQRFEAQCVDAEGTPLADTTIEVIDALGDSHRVRTDRSGRLEITVPIGPLTLVSEGRRLEGERRRGERELFPDEGPLRLVWVPEPCRIRFVSPRPGEVFVAGSAIRCALEIEPAEARATEEPIRPERWRVNGPARLEERDGDTWLVLEGREGEVTVYAEALGVGAQATIAVTTPRIARLQVLDHENNAMLLYDHTSGRAAPGELQLDSRGEPLRSHPAALRFGTRPRLRVWLTFDQPPSHPSELALALISDRLRDERTIPPPGDRKRLNTAMTFLPRGGLSETVFSLEARAGQQGPFELLADRELPACVRRHELRCSVRCNVRHDEHRFAAPPEDPRAWPEIGRVRGLEILALWNAPAAATGRALKPGEDPLKKTELDPFHVRHAVRWADGGWHLRMPELGAPDEEKAGSIPALLLERFGHYPYPEGYEGKDGLPAEEHPPPPGLAELPIRGVAAPTSERRQAPQRVNARTRLDRITVRRPAAAAPVRLPVVTGGHLALSVALDPNHPGASVRFTITLDGETQLRTRWLTSGETSERLEFDVPSPGFHEVVLQAESLSSLEAPAWWATIDLETSPCPWSLRRAADHAWGFEVLDHPLNPGGAHVQAASVVADALAALGVPSRLACVRARADGAVILQTHDPVTIGAPCFDRHVDWGPRVAGFAVIEPDRRRESEDILRPHAPLGAEYPVALDHVERRAAAASMLATTLHARRRPRPGALLRPTCRCGHGWDPERWHDWPTRIRSGAPVRVLLRGGFEAPAHWGALQPGSAYTVRYGAPGNWVTEGPAQPGSAGETRTRMFHNRLRTPQRFTLDLWGTLFRFDATGSVRDPLAPELGAVGRLEPIGVDVFEAGPTTLRRVFPLELAAPFERRWHHERSFRLPALERIVRVNERLRLLFSVIEPYTHYTLHGRVFLDGRFVRAFALQAGQTSGWLDLGTVENGLRKLRVLILALGHGPMRAGLHGALTLETAGKRPRSRKCVICGAQPVWSYQLEADDETPLIGAVIHPCPRCGVTVHDDDNACWACALELQPRRFAPAGYAPPVSGDQAPEREEAGS